MNQEISNLALATLGTFVGGNLVIMATNAAKSENIAVGGAVTAAIGAALVAYAPATNAAKYAGYTMFGIGALGIIGGFTGTSIGSTAPKSQSTGAAFGRKTSPSTSVPAVLQIAAKQRQDKGLEPLSWDRQAVTAGMVG